MQSLPGERHVQCNARTTQNHSQDVHLQRLKAIRNSSPMNLACHHRMPSQSCLSAMGGPVILVSGVFCRGLQCSATPNCFFRICSQNLRLEVSEVMLV